MTDQEQELMRAINALYLEVPKSVADDIKAKALKAIGEENLVPTGCSEKFGYIENAVEELYPQWRDGNRDHVWKQIMRLPKSAAIAVTAHLAASAVGLGSYFVEKA